MCFLGLASGATWTWKVNCAVGAGTRFRRLLALTLCSARRAAGRLIFGLRKVAGFAPRLASRSACVTRIPLTPTGRVYIGGIGISVVKWTFVGWCAGS